jgi:hypothetical protein
MAQSMFLSHWELTCNPVQSNLPKLNMPNMIQHVLSSNESVDLHSNYQTSVKNSVIRKEKYIDACVNLPLPV